MDAEPAKVKNIINMAFGFSAMTRVFEKGSTNNIVSRLTEILPQIASSKSKQAFNKCHHSFCQWFEGSIFTAKRKKKNGTIKPSGHASYGQGAKVLDVALKVYVYYCHLPDPKTSEQTIKWLNAAVDNKMMKHLKKMPDPEASSIHANSIEDVDKETYIKIQNLVRKEISSTFSGSILPVQWDDIMWRKLNGKDEIHSYR